MKAGNPIKRLGPNLEGRDFVIGDLHGSYACLMNALKNLDFNYETDRLISVGDLIDRGPQSLECLELLEKPWFHATFANHEELALDYLVGNMYDRRVWFNNGGLWFNQLDGESKQKASRLITNVVAKLPYVITVEKRDGSIFHVIHAEFPYNTQITDAILADESELRKSCDIRNMDGNFLTWGRYLFYIGSGRDLENDEQTIGDYESFFDRIDIRHMFSGLSPVYSGHTIMRKPTRIGKQTNLDTKAFGSDLGYYVRTHQYLSKVPAWCGLTITEPATDKFWLSTANSFRKVSPLVLR